MLDVPYWCIALGSLVFGPLYGFQNIWMGGSMARMGVSAVELNQGGGGSDGGGNKSGWRVAGSYALQLLVVWLIVRKVQSRIKRLAIAK
eukprot:SAG25_NODE_555_length_6955_cov_15.736289_2_plen_89_part_00